MAPPPVSNKIKVMVVEDEELYSDLLRIGLSQLDQLEVIGVFQNGKSALDAAPQLKPDVAILDIELGTQLNGIQVGIQLRRQLPDIGIVLLSNHGDPQFLSGLPKEVLGGWSYLLKKSASNVVSLARVIEGAADGYVVMDAEISKNINIRGFDSRGSEQRGYCPGTTPVRKISGEPNKRHLSTDKLETR